METIHPIKLRIFQAIEQIIKELGVEAVTFSEIAARVFMQPSSIAYYFSTKSNMLTEFIRWRLSWSPELPHGDIPAMPPEEAAVLICSYIDAYIAASPYQDPVTRAISRSMMIEAQHSTHFFSLMNECVKGSEEAFLQPLAPLRNSPASEPARWEAALREFFVLLLGQQIMGFFDMFHPGQTEALHSLAERTKRALIKDEYYPPKTKGTDS